MPKPTPNLEVVSREIATFAGFGETVLGFKFYPKQAEVLNALQAPGSMVSFAACNGGGKTTRVMTTAALASLILHKAHVRITSGSFRQIKHQLMPALHSFSSRFPGYRFLDTSIVNDRDAENTMLAFSTKDAGKFEGFHGDAKHPLFLGVDEAKTVANKIFEAVDRCRIPRSFCRILMESSCGYASGTFYESQTTKTGMLTHPPIRLRADECPHISAAEIEAMVRKWGPNHPLVKSALFCEFMEFVEGAVIQVKELDEAIANPPDFQPGIKKARCDFAWSEAAAGDENVLALRDGNRITIEKIFRGRGQFDVCGRFVREFQRMRDEFGLIPDQVEGDGSGEGMHIINSLRDMGWPITPILNGSTQPFDENYANVSSEEWCEFGQSIIRGEVILPQNDSELYGQLLNRRIVPHSKGKMCIESKQSMKDPNRIGGSCPSPDRAEACAGAWARARSMQSVNLINRVQRPAQIDWGTFPKSVPQREENEGPEDEGIRRYVT